MKRKLLLISLLLSLFVWETRAQSTYYPFVLGYAAGESVEHNGASADTFKVSFSGGAPFANTWQTHGEGYKVLLGFKHDILFAENAFGEDLFASKGYFSDFVELKWDLINYANQVTAFKVYRKELGSTDDSVMVANLAADARSWKDEYSESGVMYEYTLFATGITSSIAKKFLNYVQGIGFRVPTGRISGRVTYAGGAAVPNVNIIAETDDNFSGSSILFNGTDAYLAISPSLNDPLFKFDTAFTFQAWVRPVDGSPTSCVFEKQGQYKLSHADGVLTFLVGGTQTVTLNFTEKVDTFFHVTAMVTADSIKLIVNYDEYTSYISKDDLTAALTPNNNEITIGKSTTGEFFDGYMDEVRIWHKSFSEDQVSIDFGRYIAGTESGLTAYYRLNEAIGDNFYDLSRKGFTFNEHHGYKSSTATWSSVVPMARQLAVKGITDSNGNYIISGIPYATDGTVYRFVPVYGIHSFDPTERLMFIGPGSTTHSNVNFTDVASFPVVGEVFYRDTYFPVQGVSIKIDGQLAVRSDGTPVMTDATGRFEVDVPIGKHYIEVEKYGHGFENAGRFPYDPANPDTLYDFQQSYTFQSRFQDTTLIKVIGKVVGGPVQASKPKGLGKTTNNIGNGKIIFGTQKGYDLTDEAAGIVASNDNISYEGANPINDGTTIQTILSTAPKQVEIEPDPITGEYVAYLLPEKYLVKSVTAGIYTYPASFNTTVDLTNALLFQTETDSVQTGVVITGSGDEINTYRLDSIRYNKNLDFIYRVTPDVAVANKETGDPQFWESEVNAKDGTPVTVVDGSGNPLTFWPIFKQRKKYEVEISVFEQYENADFATNGNPEFDNVPVTDGTVTIQNDLSTNNTPINYQIDNTGKATYAFTAGMPNIIGDYTRSMTVIASTGNGGTIQTEWQGNDAGSFKGYVFGGLPTGSNFVTAGPSKVDMILRDPYGSSSFTTYEVGNTVSKTSSFDVTNSNAGTETLTLQLGAEVKTFAGVGVGVITEVDYSNDLSIGIEHEEIWLDNNTTTSTTTNTKAWQTSSDAAFVGAPGDVFIGHSTNIVYGISNLIELIPSADCAGACAETIGSYGVGPHKTIRVNPEFGTAFQFTQNHIENYLIPNLEMLRDNYLLNSVWHTSIGTNFGDAGYAAPNTTVTETSVKNATDTIITSTGDSYTIELIVHGAGKNWTTTKDHFVDSVAMYNEEIKTWKQVLYENEKEKKEATLIENLSFDAGTIYSSSATYDDTEAKTSTFEFTVSPKIAGEVGGDFNGFGLKFAFEESYSHTETQSDGTEVTNSVTFGFELSDPDEGDYFSIDVKKPKSHTGPVFVLRGGQSQCPHEDAEVTDYYLPGTIISEASMQREVPTISCNQPIQINVPEDEPALFNVGLGNSSQTGDDAWFVVTIDEQSNQNGALIKLDGAPITNGRVLYVPASSVVNKIFTIEKTDPAINDYENIGIILQSVCQGEIADTVLLSAYFQPVCTGVVLSSPADQWVVNNNSGTDLTVNIGNYNLSHTGFEKVLFQYKPISSSQWITDRTYFVNNADYVIDTTANGPDGVEWINNQASLSYDWDMSSLQDRNYNLRAVSTCADGTDNSSDILVGIKDTKNPKVFGTPQPGDGILEPGDDVMISFDEEIEAGLLLSSNFSVRGVLNGAELSHNSALYFDGVDDYASAMAGVNLNDKSFSIELWTKRGSLTEGVLFQQGDIELGFDASDRFYVRIGATTATTGQAYAFTDKWIHFTVSYDKDTRDVNVFVAYDGYNSIDLSDFNFPDMFEGDGKMYVGNNQEGTSGFDGYMHDLRVWERTVGYGEANGNMIVSLTGNEIGLSGFWPMNDLFGDYATDLSRAHHAVLYGPLWQVFPSSYAQTFDGISSRLDINSSSSIIINEQMDFTLEFWFKGATQANTVMFSNGKANGTEPAGATENIWIVGFDANGKLYTKNNGTTIINTSADYLDDNWHHFALVLRRKGNTSMYVDGNLDGYESSSAFGGLFSNEMTIGASRHYTNGTPYENYFAGAIDEFRVWRLARTAKLLAMDMNSKLQGDEIGLSAYYPFDKYDSFLILQHSLADCDYDDFSGDASVLSAVATNEAHDNTNVPSIKDARPVQNLAFSWVVNTDRIILNIDEPAELVEKCVIEFTAERIEDLNENRLSSPETWTAYIKKNTIVWDETELNFEKLLYDALSFQVDILNSGGVDQNFVISNLPSWLTASSESGTLGPDSKETITFTVDPSTNIGNYDITLYLSSDFGYNEKLNLGLNVYQTPPDWTVNTADFQYSMGVIGQVKIDGIFSTDENDMVGAFVNNQCRGVAKLQYVEQYDMFEAFLNIYSNTEAGEDIEFRIWNASEGTIHLNVTPVLAFEYNTFVGTPSSPITLETNNSFSREIPLAQGWTWISFNLNDPDFSDVNTLFTDVQNSAGDQIKGQTAFDNYGATYGWAGSLSATGGFNVDEMYMIKSTEKDTLAIAGSKVNPMTTTITLNSGWNWIGYTPQNNIPLATALGNFNPASGDIIKSQYAFAMYDVAMGWIGSLDYMKPGLGYMYKNVSATATSFVYPNSGVVSKLAPEEVIAVNGWNLTKEEFQFNMSIVGELLIDGVDVTENHIVGAFVDNECRGVCKPILVNDKMLYFMTVYANADEVLSFRLIDEVNNITANIEEEITFSANSLVGNFEEPQPFTVKSVTGIDAVVGTSLNVYPNPTSGKVMIELPASEGGVVVEVTDITGKRLYISQVYSSTWQLDFAKFGQGMYFLNIHTPDAKFVEKISVVK